MADVCTCYDGGCRACVKAEERRQRDLIRSARDSALEESALTIEAFAESKTPNYWAALRECARRVRDLKKAPVPR